MSDLKVVDRRWWARGDQDAPAAEEPKLKPKYVEELEAQIEAKNKEIQQLLSKYRGAADEFDQARARLRKEVTRDVERGRRSMLASFLEVLDNLDRALNVSTDRAGDPFVHGVSLVRQQFLSTLETFGVRRIDPLGQPFDPSQHDAVTTVTAANGIPEGQIIGVVRPGYFIGDEVLRPAQVAVAGPRAD
jgi:molecular chaperone GrpE